MGKNLVGFKWVYKIKRNSDGCIERFKDRLVAKVFTHVVVKMNILRTVLVVAASRCWPLYQLDVNNVFLLGHIDE